MANGKCSTRACVTSMQMGWIDFMQHLVAAVTIDQFWCSGPGCQTMPTAGPITVSQYFSVVVNGTADDKWKYLGIAIAIMGAMQMTVVGAHVVFNWQKR